MKGIDAPVHLVHILRENTVILGTRGNAQLLTKIITKYTQDIFIYLFIYLLSIDTIGRAIATLRPLRQIRPEIQGTIYIVWAACRQVCTTHRIHCVWKQQG